MTSKPFISIIVPTYHDWERLQLCIQALDKQTYPKELYEVIIVNNDSNDLVPDQYYLPRNFVILSEGKPGSYAARNKGIDLAKGDIYGFTDSDCIPHPNWIENAVKILEKGNIDRIGGDIELFYQDDSNRTWVELYEVAYGFNQKRMVEVNKGAVTANLFVKKELFDKVGKFDCSKKSGEDIRWNRRANSFGYNLIFAKDVKIDHPARSTFKALKNKKLRELGGVLKFDLNRQNILKNVSYLPFLFYISFFHKTYRLFTTKMKLSKIEKAKVVLINIYLFKLYFFEFFRLMFGGERLR
ncbi:glycosyltransferase [Pontibacter sp. 172403-2]|uniref:glycosyltransferase n=1 Tax=Pontibacter rufus TaxID=2791028 RepID=UPI0018AFE686|nr:glycosyltransferase [Pontibacter sp. 172403-2]MBF9252537.1 glycosyltransferase [Pontibacter sp. 172403-2]